MLTSWFTTSVCVQLQRGAADMRWTSKYELCLATVAFSLRACKLGAMIEIKVRSRVAGGSNVTRYNITHNGEGLILKDISASYTTRLLQRMRQLLSLLLIDAYQVFEKASLL